MAYWIRKFGRRAEGPYSREEIGRRIHLGLLGSLDELSENGTTWTRCGQSDFWNCPVPEPPVGRPAMRTGHASEGVTPANSRSGAVPPPKARVHGERKAEPATLPPPDGQSPETERTSSSLSTTRGKDAASSPPPLPGGSSSANPPARSTLPGQHLLTREEERAARMASAPPAVPAVDFSIWRILFGSVFRSHGKAELESILMGRASLFPQASSIPATWLWIRVLFWSVGLSFVMLIMAFSNPIMYPGFFFLAGFGVPAALLIFFLECDLSRSLSIWKAFGIFLIGGTSSLIFTGFISESVAGHLFGGFFDFIGIPASVAGPTEEPAKLLLLLFFAGNRSRYPFILNGILIGAAVGAGFAAFETAGYIFIGLNLGDGVSAAYMAVLRGLLAPFMHIAWTSMVGGALWQARGMDGTLPAAFCNVRFLLVFALAVVLHILWNSGLVAILWLGVIAWLPLCYYLRKGCEQLAAHPLPSEV